MGQLKNTIKHGDSNTKLHIAGTIVMIVLALVCAVIFGLTVQIPYIIATVIFLIAAYIIGRNIGSVNDEAKYEDNQSVISDEKMFSKSGRNAADEAGAADEEDEADENSDYMEQYDKKELKKLFVAYKVKKEHKPILIDMCQSKRVKQCPAYMWTNWGKVHFLLLEEKPRMFTTDISEVSRILFDKGVDAHPEDEYTELNKSKLVSQVFGGLVPAYYEVGRNMRTTTKKNLYTLGKDINLTAQSAKAAFEMLKCSFDIPESSYPRGMESTFVKDAYKQKILWQEGILQTQEYKDRLKYMIQGMAERDITAEAFCKNVEQLVERQIITQDYADYYLENRHRK